MKKIAFLLLAAYILLPIPLGNVSGVYNTVTGIMWCRTDADCRHEIAHYIDDTNGWTSETVEYRDALTTYLLVELKVDTRPGDPLAVDIVKMTGKPVKEIYADIYAMTNGEPPPSLREFYECRYNIKKIKIADGYILWHTQRP